MATHTTPTTDPRDAELADLRAQLAAITEAARPFALQAALVRSTAGDAAFVPMTVTAGQVRRLWAALAEADGTPWPTRMAGRPALGRTA